MPNQARLIKEAEEALEEDNEQTTSSFWQLRLRMMRMSFFRSLERYI